MSAERRRLSVTITGPEVEMLDAMARLLRSAGYLVLSRDEREDRAVVTRKTRAVVTALRSVTDGQLEGLARSWRFARLELERRLAEGDG